MMARKCIEKYLETHKSTYIGRYRCHSAVQTKKFEHKFHYYILDIPTGKVNLETPLNLSDMKVMVDRKAEWNQIYYECWRQMRDFFYYLNMHGVDWEGLKKKYGKLAPYGY
mgnify:CR=1 FL=1